MYIADGKPDLVAVKRFNEELAALTAQGRPSDPKARALRYSAMAECLGDIQSATTGEQWEMEVSTLTKSLEASYAAGVQAAKAENAEYDDRITGFFSGADVAAMLKQGVTKKEIADSAAIFSGRGN